MGCISPVHPAKGVSPIFFWTYSSTLESLPFLSLSSLLVLQPDGFFCWIWTQDQRNGLFSKKGKRLKRCSFPGMQRASWFQELTDVGDQDATSASWDPERHWCRGLQEVLGGDKLARVSPWPPPKAGEIIWRAYKFCSVFLLICLYILHHILLQLSVFQGNLA